MLRKASSNPPGVNRVSMRSRGERIINACGLNLGRKMHSPVLPIASMFTRMGVMAAVRVRAALAIALAMVGSFAVATAFFSRFLDGHSLYNAHLGVRRIVASDETPAGSFEKPNIFLFGTLSPAAPAHHMDVEEFREM
jgi:hypothetical protein